MATAVVVGVGPGLGAALVRTFANEGYTVFAAARSASALPPFGEQSKDRVVPIDCDATVEADVERVFESASKVGTPEVAIFNAGAFVRSSILETKAAEFERCWRVGCFAGFLVGQAAARARPAGQTGFARGDAGAAETGWPRPHISAVDILSWAVFI